MSAPAATSLAEPLYPPEGPQSIGQVLDAAFGVFKISLVRCLLFGVMATIAGQLPNLLSIATGRPFGGLFRGDPSTLALAVVGSIATVYFSAAILLRQREIAQGRRQSARSDLAQAGRRLPSLVGVAAVSVAVLAIVPVAAWALARGGFAAATSQYSLIGTLTLLSLPVLWLLPGLAMAVAVAVLTPSGPLSALRQGIALVRGSWWRTMLTFGVWAVLLTVLSFVAVILIVMMFPLVGARDVATVSAATPVVFVALKVVGLPFLVAILLTVYGELQVRRRGVDLERRIAGSAQT